VHDPLEAQVAAGRFAARHEGLVDGAHGLPVARGAGGERCGPPTPGQGS
jgi:hypothetical protein